MRFHIFDELKKEAKSTRGRVSFTILLFGLLVAGLILAVNFNPGNNPSAWAQSTATTTVTILNTPPLWTVNAQEEASYGTSSPAVVGVSMGWNGVGTSPNGNNYYLLICKSSSTPTANASAPPTCGGGAGNLWAVSTSTVSGTNATSTYTPSSTDPQINAWFAWICDGNSFNPKCNTTYEQGSGSTASPFYLDHRPQFTSFTNNSPAVPGATVTWTALASSSDNFTGTTTTIQLFVCKSNDFTGSACGSAGTVCTSTASVVNPTCNYTIPIPTLDQGYPTYGYVIDQFLVPPSAGVQGNDATETVSNVAPTITSSSINLLNQTGSSTQLILTNPGGQTTGFEVTFTASYNNSCQSPLGGQSVVSATIDVFRSGVGLANCSSSGNYNAASCYPSAVGTGTWAYSCSQNGGSCAGTSSVTSQWTCTFPLWYFADPTDGTATSTQYYNQNWIAAVQASNYKGATSAAVTSANTSTVLSFLASQLNTPSINFGSLNSGSSTPTLAATTSMSELGNLGLNETLYGVSMCTNYPNCPVSTTSTIPVGQIAYATSAVSYASGVSLQVNPGSLLAIQINKSTSTVSSSIGSTYWGLSVPSSIILAGAYTGQNTFIAVRSNPSSW
jgi:hypothetical protein